MTRKEKPKATKDLNIYATEDLNPKTAKELNTIVEFKGKSYDLSEALPITIGESKYLEKKLNLNIYELKMTPTNGVILTSFLFKKMGVKVEIEDFDSLEFKDPLFKTMWGAVIDSIVEKEDVDIPT